MFQFLHQELGSLFIKLFLTTKDKKNLKKPHNVWFHNPSSNALRNLLCCYLHVPFNTPLASASMPFLHMGILNTENRNLCIFFFMLESYLVEKCFGQTLNAKIVADLVFKCVTAA